MIDKIREYADEAVDFAAPYVRSASDNAANAAKNAKDYLAKGAKRKIRAAKRYRFIVKTKKVLDLISSLMLLAATIIALVSVIKIKFLDENKEM